ncbi:uncharacterized protein METZ01_LOCUS253277, partial [marine metagenome]
MSLFKTSFIILSGVLAPADMPTEFAPSNHFGFISSAQVTWKVFLFIS